MIWSILWPCEMLLRIELPRGILSFRGIPQGSKWNSRVVVNVVFTLSNPYSMIYFLYPGWANLQENLPRRWVPPARARPRRDRVRGWRHARAWVLARGGRGWWHVQRVDQHPDAFVYPSVRIPLDTAEAFYLKLASHCRCGLSQLDIRYFIGSDELTTAYVYVPTIVCPHN